MPRYHVTTFGCQMNEHDSERMKGMLESLGYDEIPERREADLILFNTCSIREKADERFIAHLQEARAAKRRRPEVVVGVGGCWAQSVKEDVFRQFPFVDVAFGPGQVHKLAEFLTSDSLTAQGYFEFEGFTGHLPEKRARDFQGWLQISVGSVLPLLLLHSAVDAGPRGLAADGRARRRGKADGRGGVRELTLLGQNVNSYGRDLRPRESFSELLARVDAVDGIERIRYTSPHPKDMREDVARATPSCRRCASTSTFRSSRDLAHPQAMRRTYNRERYLARVAMLREHLPDVALTTDHRRVPGETEEDFRETLEVAEEVGYDGAFTFIYSPRRGTEAADLAGRVPHEVAVERMERLVEVVQRRAREPGPALRRAHARCSRRGPVAHRSDPDTRSNAPQQGRNFTGVGRPGEFVPVHITAATSQTLAGEASLLAAATAA